MAYQITATRTYIKHFQRLSVVEKKQVVNKLKLLAENPAHPSLRAKLIKGQNRIWECSANMDIRIIWQYKGQTVIVTLDVGHHDILKKF